MCSWQASTSIPKSRWPWMPRAARELVDLARQKNVYLACAPCSMLSETAQTVWQALREGVIGRVRLVYANFDDGMIAPEFVSLVVEKRDRRAMARQRRIRSGLHLRACRLCPDLAGSNFSGRR